MCVWVPLAEVCQPAVSTIQVPVTHIVAELHEFPCGQRAFCIVSPRAGASGQLILYNMARQEADLHSWAALLVVRVGEEVRNRCHLHLTHIVVQRVHARAGLLELLQGCVPCELVLARPAICADRP